MPGPEEGPPFDILEHTADIGLRVRGRTIEELFENAIRGLIQIVGARGEREEREERVVVPLDADDPGAALVEVLDGVIFLVDAHHARIAKVGVTSDGSVVATLGWAPSEQPVEGTELKATTYHQLKVESSPSGYEARVYFDV
jgi:SHS2 domain-containing protein